MFEKCSGDLVATADVQTLKLPGITLKAIAIVDTDLEYSLFLNSAEWTNFIAIKIQHTRKSNLRFVCWLYW